jgi:hypothetical protein
LRTWTAAVCRSNDENPHRRCSLLDARFREIFPHEELRFVRTIGEALRALDVGDYALTVIGMHFDDSKMFELLWHIKARRSRALGACDFIDVRKSDAAQLRERLLSGFSSRKQAFGTSLA